MDSISHDLSTVGATEAGLPSPLRITKKGVSDTVPLFSQFRTVAVSFAWFVGKTARYPAGSLILSTSYHQCRKAVLSVLESSFGRIASSAGGVEGIARGYGH